MKTWVTNMIRNQRLLTGLMMTVLLMISGCAAFPGGDKPKAPRLFVLELPDTVSTPFYSEAQPSAPSLLIARPTAAPGFNTPAMAYVKEKYRLDYFAYNRWVDTPANMLWPLITKSIQQTGIFSSVMAKPTAGETDWRLETKILKLQQVFTEHRSELQLVIAVQLFDERNNRVVVTSEFNLSQPGLEENPYAGVVAANTAVANYLDELNGFLALQRQ